ncbi:hypothetical protein ACU8DI_00745 [Psychroserpens sp. BH13MA-6]
MTFLMSCKTDSKETATAATTPEDNLNLSAAEKIAKAHGLEYWKDVSKIEFTFQVDRDTIRGNGRSWTWFPKQDSVMMQAGEQDVKFHRKKLDSVPLNADKAFVNDKFWLLIPFQLVWDEDKTISEPSKDVAPISKQSLNKITLTYGEKGGYTPGDAYDIYFDDDYMIREWVFRQGNSKTPTMTTTFENYQTYNGLKLAMDHKKQNGNWNLRFSDIHVE